MQAFAAELASGAMAHLRELRLFNNQIGDKGLEALSGALASGALTNCPRLLLASNQIGDVGLEAFASALTDGERSFQAFHSMADIFLGDNNAKDNQAVRNAARYRRLKVNFARPTSSQLPRSSQLLKEQEIEDLESQMEQLKDALEHRGDIDTNAVRDQVDKLNKHIENLKTANLQ